MVPPEPTPPTLVRSLTRLAAPGPSPVPAGRFDDDRRFARAARIGRRRRSARSAVRHRRCTTASRGCSSVHPDRIEIRSDPERMLRAADPDGREQRLAIGAAVFNVRLALLRAGDPAAGHATAASVPGRRGGDHATAGPDGCSPTEEPLLRAIPDRHTNRKPFTDAVISAQDRSRLAHAAEQESGWLAVISDAEQRARLHALLASANADLLADPDYRAEFVRWVGRTTCRGRSAAGGGRACSGRPRPVDGAGLRRRPGRGSTSRQGLRGRAVVGRAGQPRRRSLRPTAGRAGDCSGCC